MQEILEDHKPQKQLWKTTIATIDIEPERALTTTTSIIHIDQNQVGMAMTAIVHIEQE